MSWQLPTARTIGVLAFVLPPSYAAWQLQAFDAAQGGCGMPILGIVTLALILALLLSVAATALSASAYRDPATRGRFWRLELGVLALPALTFVLTIVLLVVQDA